MTRILLIERKRMMTKRRVLRAISLLAAVFVLSGCVDQSKAERLLIKALQEKYDEEFIVLDSIVTSANWLNAGDLHAVCCPKSNDKLFFETSSSTETGKINWDKYMSAIVREEAYAEMEELLSQYYTDFFLDVRVVYTDFKFVDLSDISVSSYEEICGEKANVHFDVAVSIDEANDIDNIKKILQKYSEQFDVAMLVFQCSFASPDIIKECQELEKNDIWENFYMNGEFNSKGIKPIYTYIFLNGEFYLYELSTYSGFQRFDKNGNSILESEE